MKLLICVFGFCAVMVMACAPIGNNAYAEAPMHNETGDAPEENSADMVTEEEVDPCADFSENQVQRQRCQTHIDKVERMKAAAEKRKLNNAAKKKQRTSGFKKNVKKKKEAAAAKAKEAALEKAKEKKDNAKNASD